MGLNQVGGRYTAQQCNLITSAMAIVVLVREREGGWGETEKGGGQREHE